MYIFSENVYSFNRFTISFKKYIVYNNSMFHHYDDAKFTKIIDEFILSSTNSNEFYYLIKNIDQMAIKLGISFYHMMFLLVQRESIDNKRKRK
jgi:hypothetical protein